MEISDNQYTYTINILAFSIFIDNIETLTILFRVYIGYLNPPLLSLLLLYAPFCFVNVLTRN